MQLQYALSEKEPFSCIGQLNPSITVLGGSVVVPSEVRWILMFLGLPDPDPSLFVRIRILPPTSKKSKKILGF
jgi:hypothetical protein